MMGAKVFILLGLMAASGVNRVNAYGLESEEQKKQDRFIQCLLAIEEANTNEDDRLSQAEYQPFLYTLSHYLFDEEVIGEKEELPHKLSHLYDDLVTASGAPPHDNSIDIFGAKMDQIFLNEVSQDRLNKLHAFCEMTMKELALMGPRTDPPLFLTNLIASQTEEEEGADDVEEIKSQGDIDFEKAQEEISTEMVSVHSSFIAANFASLTERELDLSKDGILYAAYMDFVDELLNNVCEMGLPCEGSELEQETLAEINKQKELEGNDHSQHEHTKAKDHHDHHSNRRFLCGETRRKLCGSQNRRLLREAVLDDLVLYEAKEHTCPIGFQRHDHSRPICYVIYAHWDVIVKYFGPDLINEVEHNYSVATYVAIDEGMLQEAMERVDPYGEYVIVGVGEHRYPVEDDQATEGEAKAGHGRNLRHVGA